MATLLTLPAAAALAICAPAFTAAFFVGGKFTAADGAIMAHIVVALVAGLPAYVIVKILNPGFFAREDLRTPVWTALASLIINIAINLYVVERYGIVGLAGATAASASINCLLLYSVLHRRGWFHFTTKLAGKIARQIVAVAAMSALLWWMMPLMKPYYGGGVLDRIWSLCALVAAGGTVFFAVAFLVGALDKDLVAMLTRRRAKAVAPTQE
jgi:putative peptidoglycan lipid II flippase